jgi:hypothetical protein
MQKEMSMGCTLQKILCSEFCLFRMTKQAGTLLLCTKMYVQH